LHAPSLLTDEDGEPMVANKNAAPPGHNALLVIWPSPCRPGNVEPAHVFFAPRKPFGHGAGERMRVSKCRGPFGGASDAGSSLHGHNRAIVAPTPGSPANPHLVAFLGQKEQLTLDYVFKKASPKARKCLQMMADTFHCGRNHCARPCHPWKVHPPDYLWSPPLWAMRFPRLTGWDDWDWPESSDDSGQQRSQQDDLPWDARSHQFQDAD